MMKAKQYAEILLAAPTTEAYEDALFGFLEELVVATLETMKKRSSGAAALACVRETFTKWKSIVANVKAANPELVIDDALFPKYFAYSSPPLFAMALEGKVFLGYTADAEDAASAREGRDAVSAFMMRDRVAELQRQAKQLGIQFNPAHLL